VKMKILTYIMHKVVSLDLEVMIGIWLAI